MTTSFQFDKAGVKTLNADIKAALETVAAKHGIAVKADGGSYDPNAGTFKPRVVFSANDADRRQFESYANLFGLEPTDFGRTFESKGKHYTIAGLNTRATKRPVLAACVEDGKTYLFADAFVKSALARAAA